jgi:hypothetical protein
MRTPTRFGPVVGEANGTWMRSPWTVNLRGVSPIEGNGEPGTAVNFPSASFLETATVLLPGLTARPKSP